MQEEQPGYLKFPAHLYYTTGLPSSLRTCFELWKLYVLLYTLRHRGYIREYIGENEYIGEYNRRRST